MGNSGGFRSDGELAYTNMQIPMCDTNTLAADVWFAPSLSTAKPVILIQTPYNKSTPHSEIEVRRSAVAGSAGNR
ncbi:MAG: hypothetical protein IT579_11775 [Verrucomicrobia subdivision 3 bacterium]|nr:hypothetical protein [Verrucomicrobiota bacterium]MCC6821401.1 hypothetical protein [Limisphaerales bacterium]